ncbi:hypothetical protein M426DRAFT_68439 [Hypoxylon sp. CI-4A]|nr:hypothetical protein M426DRAFT_68439 [Hypoxylon sp. CI-4A]
MAVLNFTLSEEGVNALREALTCLSKFSDEVSLEAKKDRLVFTTLNLSKSAYASFSFSASRFFSKYQFEGTPQYREKFFCKLYSRALLPIFRARNGGDATRDGDKDTSIQHCDVAIVDEPGKKSRFHAKIVFRHGMTTKYRLPFEVTPPVHAKFDKDQATNRWSIPSRTIRQLMDHFGPGIEYLDIHSEEDDTVNFTCFTEKVKNGEEVLKKPLHTSIAIERDEFEDFVVEEDKLHIVISVKDFRAIIQHAGILGSQIYAYYSMPSKPMQLKYDGDGIKCEFLLMTVGERGAPGQKAKKARGGARGSKAPQLEAAASRATSKAPTPVPQLPPPKPSVPRADPMPSLRPSITRPSQRPPPATFQSESLFVTQDDEHQWEPVNVDEEEEEENGRVEWDARGDFVSTPAVAQVEWEELTGFQNRSSTNMRSMMANQDAQETRPGDAGDAGDSPSQFEPTQRLSQVRKYGLFDD